MLSAHTCTHHCLLLSPPYASQNSPYLLRNAVHLDLVLVRHEVHDCSWICFIESVNIRIFSIVWYHVCMWGALCHVITIGKKWNFFISFSGYWIVLLLWCFLSQVVYFYLDILPILWISSWGRNSSLSQSSSISISRWQDDISLFLKKLLIWCVKCQENSPTYIELY